MCTILTGCDLGSWWRRSKAVRGACFGKMLASDSSCSFLSFTMLYHALPMLLHTHLHTYMWVELVPVHVDPSCAQSSQAATLEAGGADPKLSEVLVLGRCWLPIAAVRFLSFTMLYHALPMLLHTYLHTYMWVELVPVHVDPSCAQSSQAVTLEAGGADPKLSEVLVLGRCWLPIAVVRFLSFTMLYRCCSFVR